MSELLNTDGGVAIITGLLSLIGIIVGDLLRRQHRQIREVRRGVDEAREQVSNSHKSNLRDDLDDVARGVAALLVGQERQQELLAQHGESLNTLRLDLAWERRERMDLAKQVTQIITQGANL